MPSERRKITIAVIASVVFVALALAFAARPALVLGIDEEALAASVVDEIEPLAEYFGSRGSGCERLEQGLYRCSVAWGGDFSSESGGQATYEVRVGRAGCWEARARRAPELRGCIYLADY